MKSLAPVFALLASFVILCLGHGLQSVLLPARAALEGYSELVMGILMSAYFAGFIVGTRIGPALIKRVGHVHVFAAMGAGACAVMLCYPLMTSPLAWIILRFLYGLCMVHLYTVMESWLNSICETKDRGQIFAVYMILNFIAMSLGQLLFFSTAAGGFQMFSVAAILLSLSLVPLLLSRINRPVHIPTAEIFGVKKLYAASPLGIVGALTSGLISGAYWGLSAPYILNMGFSQAHIAWFMAASMIGGLMTQWPLGALSDRINRRYVLLLASALIALSGILLTLMAANEDPVRHFGTGWLLFSAVLFGGGFHPLYSLSIAHANDFVPRAHFVSASAGLIMTQSTGAVAGSILSAVLMQWGGNVTVYGYVAALAGLFGGYTLVRLLENRLPTYVMPFKLMTRTGGVASFLDPRAAKR